jgi:putative transcriptional regulator
MRKRDIGNEILQALQDIKKGKGHKRKVEVPGNIKKIRGGLHLSQAAFASLMGVSSRTLQEWEQGRRAPSGPAYSLLRIAEKHPEAFLDL